MSRNNTPLSPNTPLSFKTVPGRHRTQKWNKAPSYNYDGDDWGGYDPYDEYGGNDEPEQPPLPSQVPKQAPYGQGKPRGRTGSFDRGDDTRQFSAPAAPSAFPSYDGRQAGDPGSARSGGRGSNDFPRSRSRPRDFTNPEQAPPPLAMKPPMPPSAAPPSTWFPPRKSSLGGNDMASKAQADEARAIAAEMSSSPNTDKPLPFIRPSDIYKRIPDEIRRQSEEGGRPSMESIQREHSPQKLALLTPVEESRQSRMFMDAEVPKVEERAGNTVPERAGSPSTRSQLPSLQTAMAPPPSQSKEPSPILPDYSRADSEATPTSSDAARQVAARAVNAPPINTGGASGSQTTFSSLQNTPTTTRAPPGNDPAAEILAERQHGQPVDDIANQSGLQHQPSQGFRSAVHTAFDRSDNTTPLSRDGSGSTPGSSGVSRSDTNSTAGISPIMSRVPSAATAAFGRQQRVDEQVPPIAEEPSSAGTPTGSRPASGLHGQHRIPRKPSPGHSRNVSGETATPSDFEHGFRRSLDPPSTGTSPARTPGLETTATKRLSTPMSAVHMSDAEAPDVEDQAAEVPEPVLEPVETPVSEISQLPEIGGPSVSAVSGHTRGRSSTDYSVREADIADTANSSPDKGVALPSIAQAQRESQKQFLETHPGTPISEQPRGAGFPGSGSGTPNRADSPAKGRVREIADKYSEIHANSRRNSATSIGSSKSSWSNFDAPRLRREGTSQSQLGGDSAVGDESPVLPRAEAGGLAVRPELGREESFQPDLPGGWISTAPTPGLESPPVIEHSKITPRQSTAADEEVDLTPTTKKTRLQEAEPSSATSGNSSALDAVKNLGDQLGASLLSTYGIGHQTRDFASKEPAVPVDQPETQHKAPPGLIPMQPPLIRQETDSTDAPTSVASSVAPTLPGKDTPKAGDSLGVEGGYFNTVVPPLRFRSREASPDHPQPQSLLSPQRPAMVSTLSTDTGASDMDSDRLRKEIVRSLDPLKKDELKRESIEEDAERTQDALDAPDNERRIEHGADPLPAAELGVPPRLLTTKFSWEKEETASNAASSAMPTPLHQPQPPSPEIKPEMAYERPRSRNLHVMNPEDGVDSPAEDYPPVLPQPTAAEDAMSDSLPVASSTQPDSLVSPITKSQEYLLPETNIQPASPSQSLREIAPSPLSENEGFNSRLPSYYMGAHDDTTDDDMPHPPEKDHTTASSMSPTTSAAPAKPSGPIQPFRSILAMKTSDERIKTYNDTRQTFADMNTGLNDWLNRMLEQHPEHANLSTSNSSFKPPALQSSGSGFGTFKRGHKASPSIAKFTGKFGGEDKQRQASVGSTGGGDAADSTTRPPTAGGGIDMDKMKQGGRQFMKSAGVFGGKAQEGAKGLFAKGKSRFGGGSVRGKSGNEVPSSSSSPSTSSSAANVNNASSKNFANVASPLAAVPMSSKDENAVEVPITTKEDDKEHSTSKEEDALERVDENTPTQDGFSNAPATIESSREMNMSTTETTDKFTEETPAVIAMAMPMLATSAAEDMPTTDPATIMESPTQETPRQATFSRPDEIVKSTTPIPTPEDIAQAVETRPSALRAMSTPIQVAPPAEDVPTTSAIIAPSTPALAPLSRSTSTSASPFRRPRSRTPSSNGTSSRPLSQVFERLRDKTRSVSRSSTRSAKSRSRPASMVLTNPDLLESTEEQPARPGATDTNDFALGDFSDAAMAGVVSGAGNGRPPAQRSTSSTSFSVMGVRSTERRLDSWEEPRALDSSPTATFASPVTQMPTRQAMGMSRHMSMASPTRTEAWNSPDAQIPPKTPENKIADEPRRLGILPSPAPTTATFEDGRRASQEVARRRSSSAAIVSAMGAEGPVLETVPSQDDGLRDEAREQDAKAELVKEVEKEVEKEERPKPFRKDSDLAVLPSQRGAGRELLLQKEEDDEDVPLARVMASRPTTSQGDSPFSVSPVRRTGPDEDDLPLSQIIASRRPSTSPGSPNDENVPLSQVLASKSTPSSPQRPQRQRKFSDLELLPSQRRQSQQLSLARPDSMTITTLNFSSSSSLEQGLQEASPVTIKPMSPIVVQPGSGSVRKIGNEEDDELYESTPIAAKGATQGDDELYESTPIAPKTRAPWQAAEKIRTGHEGEIARMEKEIEDAGGDERKVSHASTNDAFEDARSEVSAEEGAQDAKQESEYYSSTNPTAGGSRRSSVSSLGAQDAAAARHATTASLPPLNTDPAEPTLQRDDQHFVMSAQAVPAGPIGTTPEEKKARVQPGVLQNLTAAATQRRERMQSQGQRAPTPQEAAEYQQRFANRQYRDQRPAMMERPMSYMPLPRDEEGVPVQETISTRDDGTPIQQTISREQQFGPALQPNISSRDQPGFALQQTISTGSENEQTGPPVDLSGMAGPPPGAPPFSQHPAVRNSGMVQPTQYERLRSSMVSTGSGRTPHSSADMGRPTSGFFRGGPAAAAAASGEVPTPSRISDNHGLEGVMSYGQVTNEPQPRPLSQQQQQTPKESKRRSGLWEAITSRRSSNAHKFDSSRDSSVAPLEPPVQAAPLGAMEGGAPAPEVPSEASSKRRTLKKQPQRAESSAEPTKKKRFSKLGSLFGRSSTTAGNSSSPKPNRLTKIAPSRESSVATQRPAQQREASREQQQQQPAQMSMGTVAGNIRGYEQYEAMRRRADVPAFQENAAANARPPRPISTGGDVEPPLGGWYGPQNEQPGPVDPSPGQRAPMPEFRRLHSEGRRERGLQQVPEAFRPVQSSFNRPVEPVGPPAGEEPPVIQGSGRSLGHVRQSSAPTPSAVMERMMAPQRQASYGSEMPPARFPSEATPPVSGRSEYYAPGSRPFGSLPTLSPVQTRGSERMGPVPEEARSPARAYADQQTPWAVSLPQRDGGGSAQSSRHSSWTMGQGQGQVYVPPPPQQGYSGPPGQQQYPPPQQGYPYTPQTPSNAGGYYPPPQQRGPPRQATIPWEEQQPVRQYSNEARDGPYPSPPFSPESPPRIQYQQPYGYHPPPQQQYSSPPPPRGQFYPPPTPRQQQRYYASGGPPPKYYPGPPPSQQRQYSGEFIPRHQRRPSSGYSGRRDDPAVGEEELIMRGASYPGQEWAPSGLGRD